VAQQTNLCSIWNARNVSKALSRSVPGHLLKLFSWKKAIGIVTVGIGAISYRIYQIYQQRGHLDSVDLWVAAITIAIFFCVVAFVGWWANRQE